MKLVGVVLIVVLSNMVTWGLSHPVQAERPVCRSLSGAKYSLCSDNPSCTGLDSFMRDGCKR